MNLWRWYQKRMTLARNDFFQFGTSDCLAMGGAPAYAFKLDGDLVYGRSGVSETFGNEMLASTEEFEIGRVELWGLYWHSKLCLASLTFSTLWCSVDNPTGRTFLIQEIEMASGGGLLAVWSLYQRLSALSGTHIGPLEHILYTVYAFVLKSCFIVCSRLYFQWLLQPYLLRPSYCAIVSKLASWFQNTMENMEWEYALYSPTGDWSLN